LVQVEEKETSEMIVDYRYISISSKSIWMILFTPGFVMISRNYRINYIVMFTSSNYWKNYTLEFTGRMIIFNTFKNLWMTLKPFAWYLELSE
jgi:hypothetical protein